MYTHSNDATWPADLSIIEALVSQSCGGDREITEISHELDIDDTLIPTVRNMRQYLHLFSFLGSFFLFLELLGRAVSI